MAFFYAAITFNALTGIYIT